VIYAGAIYGGAVYAPTRSQIPSLTAQTGAASVTGASVTLTRALLLTATGSSFVLSASPADLSRLYATLTAESGSYSVSGAQAQLSYTGADDLVVSAGDFAVAGGSVTLTKSLLLTAEAAALTVTGGDAEIGTVYILETERGSVNLVGAAATLSASRLLSALAGSVAITGASGTLTLYTGPESVFPGLIFRNAERRIFRARRTLH
jgi:hypothetical protein